MGLINPPFPSYGCLCDPAQNPSDADPRPFASVVSPSPGIPYAELAPAMSNALKVCTSPLARRSFATHTPTSLGLVSRHRRWRRSGALCTAELSLERGCCTTDPFGADGRASVEMTAIRNDRRSRLRPAYWRVCAGLCSGVGVADGRVRAGLPNDHGGALERTTVPMVPFIARAVRGARAPAADRATKT